VVHAAIFVAEGRQVFDSALLAIHICRVILPLSSAATGPYAGVPASRAIDMCLGKGSNMIRASMNAGDSRCLPLVLAVVATLLGASCTGDHGSPVASSDPADAVVDSAAGAIPVDSSGTVLAAVTYTGIPFGPQGLWTLNKLNYGPAPFTASQNYINADTLILQINAARSKGQRLVTAMTGGPSTRYTTNGQFDLAKWKAAMNTYNKSSLKTAVAAAVTDGTLIGNLMLDEPETVRWGTVLTKPMFDQMTTYAKTIFPTLPQGLAHGPPGYKWRATERFTKLDFVLYQYNHYYTAGNVVSWRDAVLAQSKLDGVKTSLSLNLLNGGKQDRDSGFYDCTGAGQAGLGTYYPNCQMTTDQVRTWGKALVPYACFMMVWQYNAAYFAKSANILALKDLATLAASKPKPSCKRS
jgi:hypothetical protein